MSFDTAPIQRFMARVRQAAGGSVRDIRLTIPEATELAANIAQVLASQSSATATRPAPPHMDGGHFGTDR